MKTIAMLGALCALLIGATPDRADAARINILLGSHHAGSSFDYEEVNPGLFYTWERPKVDLSLGAYRNSYGNLSVAALAGRSLWDWETGALSAFAGVAHYPENGDRISSHIGGNIVVVGGLQVRQGNVFVQALPYRDGDAKGLFTFGLTFDVGGQSSP